MAKKWIVKNITKLLKTMLEIVTPQLRNMLILKMRELRDYALSTPNPLDDQLIQLLVDLLDIDLDEVVPV